MRTRRLRVLSTLALLALAGCSRARGFDPMLDLPAQCLAVTAPTAPARLPESVPLAPGTARILGTVVDARSGGAVTLADASIVGPQNRHVRGDSAGGFLLDSLPAGDVSVRIRHLGYDPVVRTLTLHADRAETLYVALQPGRECTRR